jgi:hypothetical protein
MYIPAGQQKSDQLFCPTDWLGNFTISNLLSDSKTLRKSLNALVDQGYNTIDPCDQFDCLRTLISTRIFFENNLELYIDIFSDWTF